MCVCVCVCVCVCGFIGCPYHFMMMKLFKLVQFFVLRI